MNGERSRTIWLMGLSEKRLARLQQNQGLTNHCGEFAAATALGVLFDRVIPGMELAALADRDWLVKGLRCWPGGPTTPAQQARLVREYARFNSLPVEASPRTSSLYHLRRWLERPDTACLVTIAWDNRRMPRITKGAGGPARIQKSRFFWSGHTMVLAAYQPGGQDGGLDNDRWGFINSWDVSPNESSIFWMREDEFKRFWEYPLFPIGSRNIVVVKRIQ
jgi:hypothetical protein